MRKLAGPVAALAFATGIGVSRPASARVRETERFVAPPPLVETRLESAEITVNGRTLRFNDRVFDYKISNGRVITLTGHDIIIEQLNLPVQANADANGLTLTGMRTVAQLFEEDREPLAGIVLQNGQGVVLINANKELTFYEITSDSIFQYRNVSHFSGRGSRYEIREGNTPGQNEQIVRFATNNNGVVTIVIKTM